MFDCIWKYHDEDTDNLDLDTTPHYKNIREAGKALRMKLWTLEKTLWYHIMMVALRNKEYAVC